jgi:ribosomal-protein-alanine N-acetyltransferase
MERELVEGRAWMREWEATSPRGSIGFDTRASIRALQQNARTGQGLPFVVEVDGELAGQLNVTSIAYGSLSSGTIGYWIAERFAGTGATPTAVALATDHCFQSLGLHRMEICIRPENAKSLRVVEKLGFRYEGLKRRYIHINGDWRDHYCFGLVTEEVSEGVLRRWQEGRAPQHAADVPEADRRLAETPFI